MRPETSSPPTRANGSCMHPETLTSDLLAFMQPCSTMDRGAQLELFQEWLRQHLRAWSPHLRRLWGLDELSNAQLSQFPIAETSLDVREELKHLARVRPGSMENLAMRIRDIFWAAISVESSVVCPRCHETQLKILEDPRSNEIVLSCDLCTWSQSGEGKRRIGEKNLRPASRERIGRWRQSGG
jgi:hypothetical protein